MLLFFLIPVLTDQKIIILNQMKNFYYTYSLAKNGSKYDIYFDDKDKSKNISKALVEK